jgi:hypothetical protein
MKGVNLVGALSVKEQRHMPFRSKENTEQLTHLGNIRTYLVGLRRAAVLNWGEASETDRQSERLAEILHYQTQIEAIDRAIRDEN